MTYKNSLKSQNGQVLLIAILLASLLLTIGLSLTQSTIENTRSAKLQEDSVRARAAAEAGIDYLLSVEPVGEIQLESILPGENSDITGTAEITSETSPSFTTPLISKDGQYMLYMTGYDASTDQVIAGSFSANINVSKVTPVDSDTCATNAFAVELTFINTTSGVLTRRLIDTECNIITGEGNETDISFGDTIQTSTFSGDPHVLVARIIAPNDNFEGAKLTFNILGGGDWPAQGRVVISEAKTGGDVYKKIRLFQSHPQIPAEFFVTTF